MSNKRIDDLPLVSVIMSSYNYAQYIEEAIRSVFEQTYENIELVIVDDGSRDSSVDVIERVIKEAPFETRTIYKENGGQSSAFNAAFLHCSGSMVAFLDSDDRWMPSKVAEMVQFINRFPNGGVYQHQLACGDSVHFGSMISADIFSLWRSWNKKYYNIADDCTGLFLSPFQPTSGLMFRMDVLEKIMPIPDEIITCPDAYLTRTAIVFGPLLSFPAILGEWRDHEENAGKHIAGFRKFWLPVILPKLNSFYDKNNLDFSLKYQPKISWSSPVILFGNTKVYRYISGDGSLCSKLSFIARLRRTINEKIKHFHRRG